MLNVNYNFKKFVLLVGIKIGTATVESSMEIPQKIKNGTA